MAKTVPLLRQRWREQFRLPRMIDNHADFSDFRTEAEAFFAWLKQNQIGNFTVICGDRHWQYHSIHPSGVEEFACGALNDENSRMGVALGKKNGSDPQALIKQEYTSPIPIFRDEKNPQKNCDQGRLGWN